MLDLVYGGAASGKSEYAEKLALSYDPHPIYLATMKRGDVAGEERIEKHLKRREGSGFVTLEMTNDIGRAADEASGHTVLLECLTNLAANELFLPGVKPDTDAVSEKIKFGLDVLSESAERLIIVSGDLFRDGCIYDSGTEDYLRLLAGINRYVAERADNIYEAVFGCIGKVK